MTNEEFVSMNDVPAEDSPKVLGPGAQLKKAREAKKLQLGDIAKHLLLSHERIAEIESDNFRAMGSRTFALGYLRSYASSLGMGEGEIQEIIQLFDQQKLGDSIISNKPRLNYDKVVLSTNPKATRFMIYLVTFLATASGIFWWYSNHSDINIKPETNLNASHNEVAVPTPPASTPVAQQSNEVDPAQASRGLSASPADQQTPAPSAAEDVKKSTLDLSVPTDSEPDSKPASNQAKSDGE